MGVITTARPRVRQCACAEDVARLERQVRSLEAAVARLANKRRTLADVHVRLLDAIAVATVGRTFTGRDVFRYVELTGYDYLRQALADAGVAGPKSLGWVLRRGWRLGGTSFLAVQRSHKTGGGTVWQVQRHIS